MSAIKRPIIKSFQDMPPTGGYPDIPIPKRSVRQRGPSGLAIWLMTIGATCFGFYRIGITNDKNRKLRKERRECRMAILPYLEANSDLILLDKINNKKQYEEKIMKDVPGWKLHEELYSKRWTLPVD